MKHLAAYMLLTLAGNANPSKCPVDAHSSVQPKSKSLSSSRTLVLLQIKKT